jgi:hypothetical protein
MSENHVAEAVHLRVQWLEKEDDSRCRDGRQGPLQAYRYSRRDDILLLVVVLGIIDRTSGTQPQNGQLGI